MGAYVGFATVGVFCAWYMFDSVLGIDLSGDGHTTVTWRQLRHWEACERWSPAFQARAPRVPAAGSDSVCCVAARSCDLVTV